MKTDWTGSKYIGINLDWNYKKEQVILPMKGYVKKALKEYQHKAPSKPFDAPTKYQSRNLDKKYSMKE